ncbi:hypothetical protein NQK81_01395 [Amycolatopsis roodepoortensis]|uniref:hypothetical protein n=1 Tax=Amycolatopsis roodepoortensis TaxID=700274 RepID=UPI00214C2870|nr:hypothetical protein [Amycolatopsis roodepoortensis]UUV32130.1 hypothetical protein NQK81_01395 [Amycolatopsis roodepoortensis]
MPARTTQNEDDDRRFTVFVRYPDEKTAHRVTPDGGTTRRKIHAAILTHAQAERVIELSRSYLDEHPGTRMWIAPF